MDADEAFSTLGVSDVPDADSLRRAYLRQVRAHPPERDPEGFKRVRNAYDFLRQQPWLWQRTRVAADGRESDAEQRGQPNVADPPEWTPAAEPDALATNAIVTAPPRTPTPTSTPTAERAESTSVARAPGTSALFQKWIDVHDVQALDDPERTARAMIELFNARLVDSETPLPTSDTTFAVILALAETDRMRTAAELLGAFEARSRLDGASPYAFSPATAARHKLLRELVALRGLAPRRLTRLLARMIREERPLQPGPDVDDAALMVGPGFREAFAARAPTLFSAAQPVLFKPAPKSLASHGLTRVGWWVMLAVALQVLRMVPTCSSSSRAPVHEPARAGVAR